MTLDSMQALLVAQLRDIYSAEKQLTRALPRMAKGAESEELAIAFLDHLDQTKEQIRRLEQACELLGVSPRGTRCKGMEGLLAEGADTLDESGDPAVIDANLIADAQRVEHYEIAAYGTAKSIAQLLGEVGIVELMDQTLQEEVATDRKLTSIALGEVNPRAAMAGTSSDPEE